MTKSVCTLGVCHPAPPHPGHRTQGLPGIAETRSRHRPPGRRGQRCVPHLRHPERVPAGLGAAGRLPSKLPLSSPGLSSQHALWHRHREAGSGMRFCSDRGTDRKPEVQRAGIPERVPQSPVSTGATNPSFYGENDQPEILGGAEAPSPREPVGNGQAPCTELPAALLYLPSWRRHLTKTSFSLRLRRPTATHYITSSDGQEASRAARPLGAGAAGVRARCASALRWACQTPRAGRSAQPMVCLSAGSQPCADRGSSPAAAPSARHVSSATPLLGAEPGRGASGRRHLGG